MKRFARWLGRLLCSLGRHRWRQVGMSRHSPFLGVVMVVPVYQCVRCGCGFERSNCCGDQWHTRDKMIEVLTEMEVNQIAVERALRTGEEL